MTSGQSDGTDGGELAVRDRLERRLEQRTGLSDRFTTALPIVGLLARMTVPRSVYKSCVVVQTVGLASSC
ncbi:hypothetical protein BV898_19707 [Hypsibius exemplaris]|uniref:Uncharacterized protein n=1 Tax=Hypsibius exemplaris TaxID=2072580 RepID=A0A9X6RPC6_HYPEX|nr:hypothetical protein BV898_19707 [Hypsibius exemplaris]